MEPMEEKSQRVKTTDQLYASFGFSILIAGIAGPLLGVPSAPEIFRYQILGIGVLLIGLSLFLFWLSAKQSRVEVRQNVDANTEESEPEIFSST